MHAAELPRLARVLEFCRGAARVVRAGFVISAIYNVVGVSIAAAGLLQPMVCAILMPFSSASDRDLFPAAPPRGRPAAGPDAQTAAPIAETQHEPT